MAKTEISPPPWTFNHLHGAIYDRRSDFPIMRLSSRTEINANGVLAAAAPDLEAALRELVARIDDLNPPDMPYSQWGDDLEPELTGARAALARSEGKP